MGELIPNPGMKIFWMVKGDHRLFCSKHKPDDSLRPYEVEEWEGANCWACLKEIKTAA